MSKEQDLINEMLEAIGHVNEIGDRLREKHITVRFNVIKKELGGISHRGINLTEAMLVPSRAYRNYIEEFNLKT